MNAQTYRRWTSFVVALGMAIALIGASRQQTEQQRATAVIGLYLTAWQRGDHATMHQLWTTDARDKVAVEQLQNAFKLESQGTDEEKEQLRRLTGATYLVTGRPARIVAIQVKVLSDTRAIADCVAEFNFSSQVGLDFGLFLLQLLEEIKKEGHKDGGMRGFTLALALSAMAKTEQVNTAQGQIKSLNGVQGPPYITLYLRRFELVKEDGKWRIANAVTVSDQPPPSPRDDPPIEAQRKSSKQVTAHRNSAGKVAHKR